MNENLKRLMLNAGYAAPELASRAHKLSELIIRECIENCKTEWHGDSLEDICSHMKDHFGVKDERKN